MATYYVDPAAGGNNDGSDWTNAWTSLQSAADTATAGDIVYCRGTETLSAKIDFDTNSGDIDTNGPIRFIGCNASGNNDGTRFVLDGNSAATYCIENANQSTLYFENFELKNATSHGWFDGNSDPDIVNMVFINCSFNNNGGDGFFGDDLDSVILIRCAFHGNTSEGIYCDTAYNVIALFCSFHDNGDDGIEPAGTTCCIVGCLSYDNGSEGIDITYINYPALIMHNVVNGNNNGIEGSTGSSVNVLVGNRLTNNSTVGIDIASYFHLHGWNYFEDNTANLSNNSLAIEILDDGVGTDDEDNADTNEGYTSKTDGSEDFNLRHDASMRRVGITIPTE